MKPEFVGMDVIVICAIWSGTSGPSVKVMTLPLLLTVPGLVAAPRNCSAAEIVLVTKMAALASPDWLVRKTVRVKVLLTNTGLGELLMPTGKLWAAAGPASAMRPQIRKAIFNQDRPPAGPATGRGP